MRREKRKRSSGKKPVKAISQKSRSRAGGANGVPAQIQRGDLRGERRSSEMRELSALAGSEGYGACDDGGIGGRPNKQENVLSRASGVRAFFGKCVRTCIACRLLASP